MANANSYHPDHVAKFVLQCEQWEGHPMAGARWLAPMYQVRPLLTALAKEIESDKLAGIAATVAEIEDQREREGAYCRRRVTDKQCAALASALLEKYGSVRNIVKAGWNLTDEQIDELGQS